MRSRSRFRPITAGEAYRRLAPLKGLIDRSALPLPHPPGSCLAACPGLYRRFCSPPRPAAAHRSAKPACSPSSLSARSVLPSAAYSGQLSCRLFRPLPSILLPAPSRCSSQISQIGLLSFKPACSVLPLQHSPTTISRSPLATFRGPSPPNLTAPLHFLSIEPRTSRTARDPVSLSLTAAFQQIADVPVCHPSQHSTAILRASRAKPDLSATRASPSSFAPRVHGSTFHLPLDLLPSTPPLASDPSQPPKSVTTHAQ